MSVLIKGMEMPTCGHTTIRIYADGTVEHEHTERKLGTAVPVQPHGRLIDADALDAGLKEMSEIEWNQKAFQVSWAYAFEAFRGIIERDEHTVIPAEEDE